MPIEMVEETHAVKVEYWICEQCNKKEKAYSGGWIMHEINVQVVDSDFDGPSKLL